MPEGELKFGTDERHEHIRIKCTHILPHTFTQTSTAQFALKFTGKHVYVLRARAE